MLWFLSHIHTLLAVESILHHANFSAIAHTLHVVEIAVLGFFQPLGPVLLQGGIEPEAGSKRLAFSCSFYHWLTLSRSETSRLFLYNVPSSGGSLFCSLHFIQQGVDLKLHHILCHFWKQEGHGAWNCLIDHHHGQG